jgi:hypothetical protein
MSLPDVALVVEAGAVREHLFARQAAFRAGLRADRVREAGDQVEARLHLDRIAQRFARYACLESARGVQRREEVQRRAQLLVDRRGLVVAQDRVDDVRISEG